MKIFVSIPFLFILWFYLFLFSGYWVSFISDTLPPELMISNCWSLSASSNFWSLGCISWVNQFLCVLSCNLKSFFIIVLGMFWNFICNLKSDLPITLKLWSLYYYLEWPVCQPWIVSFGYILKVCGCHLFGACSVICFQSYSEKWLEARAAYCFSEASHLETWLMTPAIWTAVDHFCSFTSSWTTTESGYLISFQNFCKFFFNCFIKCTSENFWIVLELLMGAFCCAFLWLGDWFVWFFSSLTTWHFDLAPLVFCSW